MLTREQNEMLAAWKAARRWGRFMRRHWLPCACRRGRGARRRSRQGAPAGRGPGVFRDTSGRLGVLASTACTVAPRRLRPQRGLRLRCCITAGSSTSRASSSTCLRGSGRGGRVWASRPILPGARRRGFLWIWMGRAARCASSKRPPGRRRATRASASSRCTPRATGRRCWRLDRFGPQLEPALHQHAPGRGRQREGHRQPGCVPRWTRRRGCSSSRRVYGFRYAAIRKPLRNPETDQYIRTTLFIAPFTVLIPPNDRITWRRCWCARRRQHHVLLGAWHRIRRRHLADEWRRSAPRNWQSTGRNYRKKEIWKPLSAGSRRDERAMDRHPGHPDPGHGDVESMGRSRPSQDSPGASDLA